jgi:molecular chaperone GrpE
MRNQDVPEHPTGSGNDSVAAAPPPKQEPSVAEITAELAAVKDRLLRALAEQENMRAQAKRERDTAVRYAATGFAADLLSSIDNLERAIASVPEDKRSDPGIASLLTGVEATRRALLDAFARHGLRRLDPIGEKFDPHRHEAGFAAADACHPPETVISVVQPGYMLHDRLLRPALVGVSKLPDATVGDVPAAPGGTSSSTPDAR